MEKSLFTWVTFKVNINFVRSPHGQFTFLKDHIVTFQQSLAYYERMLSQSQPAYLSQLRVSQSIAKGGFDKAILTLTTVSIVVLCIQVILGKFLGPF